MIDQVKDITNLSKEESEKEWKDMVRNEVNSVLETFLAESATTNINVKYYSHVKEELESGPVLDDSKADGVLLSVVFKFKQPIELS